MGEDQIVYFSKIVPISDREKDRERLANLMLGVATARSDLIKKDIFYFLWFSTHFSNFHQLPSPALSFPLPTQSPKISLLTPFFLPSVHSIPYKKCQQEWAGAGDVVENTGSLHLTRLEPGHPDSRTRLAAQGGAGARDWRQGVGRWRVGVVEVGAIIAAAAEIELGAGRW